MLFRSRRQLVERERAAERLLQAIAMLSRRFRPVRQLGVRHQGQGEPIGSGDDAVPPKGLVSTAASPVRAPRWIFPAARVSPGVETQIAVYNPGSKAAEVDVAITYQEPKLNPEIEPVQLTIAPREQAIVEEVRRLRASGLSQRAIAAELEASGVRGRTGAPLRQTQVATILKTAS